MASDKQRTCFTLSYLMMWIAGLSASIALISVPLVDGNGWLIGYSAIYSFALGAVLLACVIGDPTRKTLRLGYWTLIVVACSLCIVFAGLIWTSNSNIPVFVEQGLSQPGQIKFKKMGIDSGGVVFKYHVADLPDCEITCWMNQSQHAHLNEIQ